MDESDHRCIVAVWRGGQRSAAAFVGRQTRGRCDLDRSWTRLGSEARWTKSDESDALRSCGDWLSRGPASSEARLRLSGGKPVDAATSTHAHRHLLMTIDIDGPSVQGAAGSEAELQLGSFCHSQHAFDAVWLLWTDLQSARAASSVSAGASFTLHVSCTSRRVVQTFLACFSTWR